VLQAFDRFHYVVKTIIQLIDVVTQFIETHLGLFGELRRNGARFVLATAQFPFDIGRLAGKPIGQIVHTDRGEVLGGSAQVLHALFHFFSLALFWAA